MNWNFFARFSLVALFGFGGVGYSNDSATGKAQADQKICSLSYKGGDSYQLYVDGLPFGSTYSTASLNSSGFAHLTQSLKNLVDAGACREIKLRGSN